MEGAQAATLMEQKREEEPPELWDESDWDTALRMPDAIKADDITKMDDDIMKAKYVTYT